MSELPPTLFLTLAGSHAHGTARVTSDVDIRGVCNLPLRRRLALGEGFEQYEGALPHALTELVWPFLTGHPTASHCLESGLECAIFDVAKFIRLCCAANPNALEILFASEADWLHTTPAWLRIHDHRRLFVTQKVHHTFMGYAMAQLKRIRTHRSWLLSPPTAKPSRAQFELPDAPTLSKDDQHRIDRAVADKVRGYGVHDIEMPPEARISVMERMAALLTDALAVEPHEFELRQQLVAAHALGLPSEVVATLGAERRYQSGMRQWSAFQTWKRQRNPARAALEAEYGYDTKHAAHLVRLMRMGLEALTTGEVRVKRPDAAELVAIRDGALSYDALLAQAASLQQQVDHAAASTALPKDLDRDQVDALCFTLFTEPVSSA